MRDELVYPLSRPGAGPENRHLRIDPLYVRHHLVDAVIKVRKQVDLVEEQGLRGS